jgi:hypothetical protein
MKKLLIAVLLVVIANFASAQGIETVNNTDSVVTTHPTYRSLVRKLNSNFAKVGWYIGTKVYQETGLSDAQLLYYDGTKWSPILTTGFGSPIWTTVFSSTPALWADQNSTGLIFLATAGASDTVFVIESGGTVKVGGSRVLTASDTTNNVASQNDIRGVKNLTTAGQGGMDIDWALTPQFTDTLTAYTVYTFSNVVAGKTIRVTLTNVSGGRAYPAAWPSTVVWGRDEQPSSFNPDSSYQLEFTARTTDHIFGRLLDVFSVVETDTAGPDLIPPPASQNLTVISTTDKSASITDISTADDLDTVLVAVDTRYIADYDASAAAGTTNERTARVQRGTTTFSNGSVFYIQTPTTFDSNLVDIRVDVEFGANDTTYGRQSYTVEPANDDSIKVWFGGSIPASVTLSATWSVIQDSGLTTKWVRGTLASGTSSGSFYSAGTDTLKSWIETGGVFAGVRHPSTSRGLFGGAYWRFKIGTTDSVQWVAGGNLGTGSYGVVQKHTYDSCSVAGKGLVTMTSGGSLTGTVSTTSGDTTKQLGVSSAATSGGSSVAGRRIATAEPTALNQWTVTRGNTTSITTAYLFVVEFTDATNVTRYRSQLDAGTLSGTFSVPGDLTYLTPNVTVRSATNTTDTAANVSARVTLAATATISRQKASTQTNAIISAVNWGGIRTAGSSSGPDTVSWQNATRKVPFKTTADSSQQIAISVEDLNDSTTYYFSAKFRDASGNTSLRSNTVSGTTQYASANPSALARVWAVDDLTKVMDQDLTHDMATSAANRTWQNGVVTLDAYKGETVAFQLILQNGRTAIPYTAVTLDSLYLADHSARIKNDSSSPSAFAGRFIDVFVAQSFTTTARTKPDDPAGDNWGIEWQQLDNYPPLNYPTRTLDTASFKGEIPKILIPVEVDSFNHGDSQVGGNPFPIAANRNRTIWVDIFVPRGATAGTYEGYVNIKENALLTRQIPVSLNVYNISMPTTGTLPNSFYFSGKMINHNGAGGVAPYGTEWWRQYRKLVQLMHRHGISLQNWAGVQNLSSVYNKLNPRADKYTLDKNGAFGQMTGTLFTTGRGYDGPFYNAGDQLIVVGEYGGSVGFTPLSEPRLDTTSHAWGTALTDSSATTGKYLFFAPLDEPLYSDTAKRTTVINFGTYLNNNTTGVKQYARQGSMGAEAHSGWTSYIKFWTWGYTTDGVLGTRVPGGNNYTAYTSRQRRDAGQYTGTYNIHSAHNTTGWYLDAHPSNLAAYLWGARKDTVQFYTLWTTAYFEEKWYTYAYPRAYNYWTDNLTPGDPNLSPQRGMGTSQIWPGNDTAYASLYDRDFDGFFVTNQVKAWRRGQQDRILLQMAADSGVTYTDLYDSLNIGRWLDKWATETDGKPLWTYRTYVTSKGVTHYVPNSGAAHNQNGYVWTRIRRELRQRISNMINGINP